MNTTYVTLKTAKRIWLVAGAVAAVVGWKLASK